MNQTDRKTLENASATAHRVNDIGNPENRALLLAAAQLSTLVVLTRQVDRVADALEQIHTNTEQMKAY